MLAIHASHSPGAIHLEHILEHILEHTLERSTVRYANLPDSKVC
jgi:hypothetical protein